MKESIRLMHRKLIQNKTNKEILQFALFTAGYFRTRETPVIDFIPLV